VQLLVVQLLKASAEMFDHKTSDLRPQTPHRELQTAKLPVVKARIPHSMMATTSSPCIAMSNLSGLNLSWPGTELSLAIVVSPKSSRG
jgi:hypothetical protein